MQDTKQDTILVLCGGGGSEHEVSLRSAQNVYDALERVISIENIKYDSKYKSKYDNLKLEKIEFSNIQEIENKIEYIKQNVKLVFIIVHGMNGEDGKLQKIFDEKHIQYVGSGVKCMELTINKIKTQKVLQENGIKVPKSLIVTKEEYSKDCQKDYSKENLKEKLSGFNFPIIIKPNTDGSSVSLYKITEENKNEDNQKYIEIENILEKEFTEKSRTEMLVQEFVTGREFTCGVVSVNKIETALEPTEIILTKTEVFDYEAKYKVGGCNEVTPADISIELKNQIQQLVLRVHSICKCRDISRTDMILDQNDELVVLEINTIPGITSTSFIPAQLAASGLSMERLVAGMLEKYVK